jgi:hypothetical protein
MSTNVTTAPGGSSTPATATGAPSSPVQAGTTIPEQTAPVSPTFPSEAILWYNVGRWGQLGYAVPNFLGNTQSMNKTILNLVDVVGRNLFTLMQAPDANLRTPPTINTITKIHRLIVRVRALLASRQVANGTPRMEIDHAAPAWADFTIYPAPYWRVANSWLQTYATLVMYALGTMCGHSENGNPLDISISFSGLVGQYFQKIYYMMNTELLGIDPQKASDPAFTLTAAQLAAYDPSQWFTSTELVDTPPQPSSVPPPDMAATQVLARGIPASMLVGLQSFPTGSSVPLGATGPTNSATPAAKAPAATTPAPASFAPPPSP